MQTSFTEPPNTVVQDNKTAGLTELLRDHGIHFKVPQMIAYDSVALLYRFGSFQAVQKIYLHEIVEHISKFRTQR